NARKPTIGAGLRATQTWKREVPVSALNAFEYREPPVVAPDEDLVFRDFQGIGAVESREVLDFLLGDPGGSVTILYRTDLDEVEISKHKKPHTEQDRKGRQDRLYEQFCDSQFRLLRTAAGQYKRQPRRLAFGTVYVGGLGL
ncbi:MAG TPA: hypothetical protein VFF01_06275, partial [Candidatus Deferrimicrobiaceae bacterium]|nr:hypothetical protein [Candidatus Deferrimicrobiaceae bacterium]